MDIERTHGRWPWVAAAAAGPALGISWSRRGPTPKGGEVAVGVAVGALASVAMIATMKLRVQP